MKISSERQLKVLVIEPDFSSIYVSFMELITTEPTGEQDESPVYKIPFEAYPPFRPHKDLINAMKQLRKYALETLEIELADASKALKFFNVTGLKISGDLLLKQSRVEMTITKLVERTGKMVKIKCPQVTMYPQAEEMVKFPNADQITKYVEAVITEVWAYLDGKFEEENENLSQLSLFPARHFAEV
jgi:hypothetical protein